MAGRDPRAGRPTRRLLKAVTVVRDWLVYLVARVALCIMQAVPIATCDRCAWLLAGLAYDLLRIRRATVDENLAYAFPDLPAGQRADIARAMWRHLVLMVCELAQVQRKIHRSNWHRYVQCPDVRQQVVHFLSMRPLVVVSGHFGNFEAGGVLSGLFGFPTYTIARPLDNPFLQRFLTRYRSATGQFMLAKQGSATQADAVLRGAGTLVLLGDQYAGPKGCWVNFFGRPASSHKAVALFALAHEAPLLLTYTRRLNGPLHFEVGLAGIFDPRDHPQANVRQITQWYHDRLEELIRRDPDQYWWLHRRWKDPRRRASSRAVRCDASHPQPVSPRSVELVGPRPRRVDESGR